MSDIDYTDEFENFLKSECEKMECMALLHMFDSNLNRKKSNYINIPIIILSSMIGILTASNILIEVPQSALILGGLSIFTSILKSIDSYKGYSKLAETHRMTSLSYSKIMKYIQVQLSLERDSRISAKDILGMVVNELESIQMAEPSISTNIINKFKQLYPEDKYSNKRPSILNGLSIIKINKRTIYEFKRVTSCNSSCDGNIKVNNEPTLVI